MGVATSWKVSQSALNSTVLVRFPIKISRANARTVTSSGVAHVNDGIAYCTPQRTLMCSSGFARQIRKRGRSGSGKVVSFFRHELGNVPCLSYRKVNSSGKALRHNYCFTQIPHCREGIRGRCLLSPSDDFIVGQLQTRFCYLRLPGNLCLNLVWYPHEAMSSRLSPIGVQLE